MPKNKKGENGGWNHRVVRAKDAEGELYLSIREVFYNSAGEICGMTQSPVDISWSDDFSAFSKIMIKMLDQPVIDDSKLKYAKFDNEEEDEKNEAAEMRRMRAGNKQASSVPAVPKQRANDGIKAKRRKH